MIFLFFKKGGIFMYDLNYQEPNIQNLRKLFQTTDQLVIKNYKELCDIRD